MLQHIKSNEEWEEKSLGAKGFTLIELLVVIVILGILAAVVVFAVSGITDHGKVAACKSQDSTVRTALEAYDAQYSAYPTAVGQIYTTGGTANFLDNDPTASNLIGISYTPAPTASPTITWGTQCTAPVLSAADVTKLGQP